MKHNSFKQGSPLTGFGAGPGRGDYHTDAETGEIFLYDAIGYWGIPAETFARDLAEMDSEVTVVRINSPGGEVFDGTAIYNAIKQHPHHVITQIDGLAASIASVIALGGDEVRMADNAYLMIHEPWSIVMGFAEDMRKEAEVLDKIGETLVRTYARKSGKAEEEIATWLVNETWFTGPEAKEAGFVDMLFGGEEEETAKALFDLSIFDNVPADLKRRIEVTLRDVGYSQKEAKTAIAKGFHTLSQRDVGDPTRRDDGEEQELVAAVERAIETLTITD